jgi:hypothetical protein
MWHKVCSHKTVVLGIFPAVRSLIDQLQAQPPWLYLTVQYPPWLYPLVQYLSAYHPDFTVSAGGTMQVHWPLGVCVNRIRSRDSGTGLWHLHAHTWFKISRWTSRAWSGGSQGRLSQGPGSGLPGGGLAQCTWGGNRPKRRPPFSIFLEGR